MTANDSGDRRRSALARLAALPALLLAASASAQPCYLVTDLGALGGGASSEGWAINGLGQVVGWSRLHPPGPLDYLNHAFLFDGSGMRDLGTLGGRIGSIARGVNDSGQVVGFSYQDEVPSTRGAAAFLWSNGVMRDLGHLESPPCPEDEVCVDCPTAAMAFGINEAGDAVGWSYIRIEPYLCRQQAFVYRDGVLRPLGALFPTGRSHAFGINAAGYVVGDAEVETPPQEFGPCSHPFVHDGVSMFDLGTLGGCGGGAIAINDRNEIAGWADLPDGAGTHAFLYSGGLKKDLGTLGTSPSYAYDLNAAGEVVGYSRVPDQYVIAHAFLYARDAMRDLNDLVPPTSGWVLSTAYGINDAGQITGSGVVGGVLEHAFLLTPGAEVGTGTGVVASVGPDVTVTFPNVSAGGMVTGLRVPEARCPASASFRISSGTCWDLAPDPGLAFGGPVTICIGYDPARIAVPEVMLRLEHWDGTAWVNVTVQPVDTVNKRVCGQTGAFSRFAVGEPFDSDGDGVPDDADACPRSNLAPTVALDGCDSGVANARLPGGCTILDRVAECAAGARSHGTFANCVAELTNELRKAGAVTGQQKDAIQSCAARARIP